MRIPSRIVCVFVALVLLPTLTACDLKEVIVRIADFESNQVDGVRFHRLDEATGQFVPGGSVRFSEPYISESWGEVVDYTILDAAGQEVLTLPAPLRRDAANPDMVTIGLLYTHALDPGWFRISSVNAAGESDLSIEQIYM